MAEGLLKGHTALITGASKGIGKAISIGFAEQGANVILVARKKEGMAEVAEACKAAGGGSVELLEMDASSKDSINALATACEGKVTVLVNNAGVLAGYRVPPLEADPDDCDNMLAVNLAAPMRLTRLLGPSIAAKGNGIIINLSSIAGIDPMRHAGYAASKWGLTGYGDSMALALKGQIRVVSIFPGYVNTPMAEVSDAFAPEEMIQAKDILEAALLPFRMSANACPTRIVVRNFLKPREVQ